MVARAKSGKFAKAKRRYFVRRRVHHKAKFTLPIVALGGLAVGIADTIPHIKPGQYNMALYRWIPYDTSTGKFTTVGLKKGLYPALGGFAVHYLANFLGINRMLSRAHVPVIRI